MILRDVDYAAFLACIWYIQYLSISYSENGMKKNFNCFWLQAPTRTSAIAEGLGHTIVSIEKSLQSINDLDIYPR